MFLLYLVPADSLSLHSVGTRFEIAGDEAHHIARVSRHKVGDRIWVSNGEGLRLTARIDQIDRGSINLIVEEIASMERAIPSLRVMQALTKSDRAHECVELLVASGVDEIIPWSADRSIGKWDEKNSPPKWNEWIRGAVKQTRRSWIPKLGLHQRDLSTVISPDKDSSQLFIALHEEGTLHLDRTLFETMQEQVDVASVITLIIGPEGGLSDRELELLDAAGVLRVQLGRPIFRSAHAGAIALASLQTSFGLWR